MTKPSTVAVLHHCLTHMNADALLALAEVGPAGERDVLVERALEPYRAKGNAAAERRAVERRESMPSGAS